MTQRCPHSPAAGTGWITDWRLTFGGEDLGWEGALATLVEAPGEHVFVALYDVTPDDAAHLDSWEGADTGLYRKIKLRVHTLDADVLAWTVRAGRLRGRAAVGALPGACCRRGGDRRRAARLRHRAPDTAVPAGVVVSRATGTARGSSGSSSRAPGPGRGATSRAEASSCPAAAAQHQVDRLAAVAVGQLRPRPAAGLTR